MRRANPPFDQKGRVLSYLRYVDSSVNDAFSLWSPENLDPRIVSRWLPYMRVAAEFALEHNGNLTSSDTKQLNALAKDFARKSIRDAVKYVRIVKESLPAITQLVVEADGRALGGGSDVVTIPVGAGVSIVDTVPGQGASAEQTAAVIGPTLERVAAVYAEFPVVQASLYGKILIAPATRGKNVLANYRPEDDVIWVRHDWQEYGAEAVSNSLPWVIAHELGHRVWRNVAREGQRVWSQEWRRTLALDANDCARERVERMRQVKPGDPFPLKVKGMKRSPPVVTHVEDGYITGNSGGKRVTVLWSEVYRYEVDRCRTSMLPSGYYRTDVEEGFCEAFAAMALGHQYDVRPQIEAALASALSMGGL